MVAYHWDWFNDGVPYWGSVAMLVVSVVLLLIEHWKWLDRPTLDLPPDDPLPSLTPSTNIQADQTGLKTS